MLSFHNFCFRFTDFALDVVLIRFFLTSFRLGAQLAFALLWKVLIGPVVLQVCTNHMRVQGTFGVVQGTFDVIQGTFGDDK
jgi:hypothetical protein